MTDHSYIFDNLKRQARRLRDVRTARKGFHSLKVGGTLSEVTLVGVAAIYARSFITSRSDRLLSIKSLKKHDRFDGEIHEHLLLLRNKLLAHVDDDVLRTEVTVHEYAVAVKGRARRLTIGVSTWDHGFESFKSEAFVNRIAAHLEAATSAVEEDWGKAANAFLQMIAAIEAETPRHIDDTEGLELVDMARGSIVDYTFDPATSLDRSLKLEFAEQYGLQSEMKTAYLSSISFKDDDGNPVGMSVGMSMILVNETEPE